MTSPRSKEWNGNENYPNLYLLQNNPCNRGIGTVQCMCRDCHVSLANLYRGSSLLFLLLNHYLPFILQSSHQAVLYVRHCA